MSKIRWRKSSRSNESGDNCVEVADGTLMVVFRDSKDPDGPKVVMSRNEFQKFTSVIKNL
ncbi:DUF397 domain-containing protein [Actinomadura sp. B10D3]|uniref:DUF397 domain-containing protein n=1 Tax=Actinomadura sp. B10D3 TaxID=3153557 RepID=UPI00325E1A68